MKHTLAGREVHVGVISAGRPQHVKDFPVQATWHVPAKQRKDYLDAGAPAVALGSTDGPGAARNAVLDHAHSLGLDAIVLDDDVHGPARQWKAGKTTPINHVRALELVVERTVEAGASLGTTSYNLNPTFIKQPLTTWGGGIYGWVVYVPLGVAGSALRQDTSLPWGEDFEFAIQHAADGSGLARVDEVIWKCRVGDVGGVSHTVGDDGQHAAAERVLARWRPHVKINAKGWLMMDVQPQPARILDALDPLVVAVSDVKPFPGNARVHDLDRIAQSLADNGQFRPIIANRRTGHIIKGNGTYAAATTKLGWREIAVSWIDVDADAETRLVLVDNRSSELGWFNDGALLDLLAGLGGDLAGTGYDSSDLADLERSLGGPLKITDPKPADAVKDAKKKFDVAEMKSLVLVASVEEYDRLLVDLDALRAGEESNADVVARLVLSVGGAG